MFFGIYENVRHNGLKSLPTSPNSSILLSSGVTLMAGAVAGAAYQLIEHPLERVRELAITSANTNLDGEGRNSRLRLFTGRMKRLIRLSPLGPVRWMYRGLGSSFLKAVPASSLALLIYETLKWHLNEPGVPSQ